MESEFTIKHSWNLSPGNAKRLQNALAKQVVPKWHGKPIKTVAGADGIFFRNLAGAAIVVMKWPQLEMVAHSFTTMPVTFPYIPGLFSFREGPVLMAALKKLQVQPDLIICDAHGIAHPRGIGLASHMGLLTGIATIGCAKSRLIGSHEQPDMSRGSWVPLKKGHTTIGAVVRTQSGVKPVYVSIGHLIDLELAIEFVLTSSLKYRLPEPIRMAHIMARKWLHQSIPIRH